MPQRHQNIYVITNHKQWQPSDG